MGKIEYNEWRSEIERLMSRPEGDSPGLTRAEIQEVTGFGAERVRRILHEFQRGGRLDVVRKQIKALDGRASTVPVYVLLPEKKGGRNDSK